MNDILTLSGLRQARLIQEGRLSSTELVRAHLQHIDRVNPALNAAIDVLRESALREAAAVDRRRAEGAGLRTLEGVPFSVKDSIEVEGTVCSAGTLGYRNRPRSERDATLVARLREAGAIPIARTNLPDLLFAFESDNLIYGRANNPYDPNRTPGGSSGGEAALIAACGTPFGLGSDAAGSVRVPAHYSGICSIKPTSRRLSRTGHVPPAGGWIEALWQIGPMARHAGDLAAMMPILVGSDSEDATLVPMPLAEAPPLRSLRVAFFTDNGIVPADSATTTAIRKAATALEGEVQSVEEYRPPAMERSYELEMKYLGPDGGDSLRRFAKSIGSDELHPLFEGWLAKLEPYRTDLGGFESYWTELDRFRAEMFRVFRNFDVLLSPVTPGPAPLHGGTIEETVFHGFGYTMTHNLTGWPAAVVRCGRSPEGLPIGIQIAAAPWREDIALAAALFLETAVGGWTIPPVCLP